MRRQNTFLGLLSGLIFFGAAMPVQAETFYGDENWNVAFTSENGMVSSFSTADINDVVSGMQPGDNVIITLDLKNENPASTDWYMQNEVLYSLEDRSANKETGGGAYTYRLYYTDKDGTVQVLFDSDTVGGEDSVSVSETIEGLHGATNALKDYFYLDTMQNGQDGKITLEVALDGETQGNHYQDTLADLQMNFAVELLSEDVPESSRTDIVKTSDESKLPLLAAVSIISGLLLLIYCIYCFMEHRKRKKGLSGREGGIDG